MTYRRYNKFTLLLMLSCLLALPRSLQAQADSLEAAARAIMESARYGALTTLDSLGQPHVRTMDPFVPENDMRVWLGTTRNSRKVQHIAANPRVALHYSAPGGAGYVTITGIARLVDDPAEKARHWKEEWEQFYSNHDDYILVEVTPLCLEVLDLARGITPDPDTWAAQSVCYPE